MTEEKLVERVTALFADSDAAQRKMIRLYAETNDAIEASAIIDSGAEVLHMLQGGLRPEVLVLDSVLSDTTIFPLLRSIRQQQIEYEPHIIVTLLPRLLSLCFWQVQAASLARRMVNIVLRLLYTAAQQKVKAFGVYGFVRSVQF